MEVKIVIKVGFLILRIPMDEFLKTDLVEKSHRKMGEQMVKFVKVQTSQIEKGLQTQNSKKRFKGSLCQPQKNC